MAGRRLGPEEAALWARVVATVQPLPGRSRPAPPPAPVAAPPAAAPAKPSRAVPPLPRAKALPKPALRPIGVDLDGGWEKRLSRGLVAPEASLDLHGHTLTSAHAMLDAGLSRAIARGDRVLLLVTGKPPRPEAERPYARGAIRAAVADWIAASRHAERIAAIRQAHPRHGGTGALYIVFRRARGG
ncbi:Smr/MutS family protein [Sphingomonas sp. IW22]|uniref:Smr/MutS family protein n=1 Tax=Sphingomonas sp. IW22 TaxID=3242489 RepID=UPI003521DF69